MPKRTIRVHVQTRGDVDSTAIVDSDTGEELIFAGAEYQWQAIIIPGQGGVACVRLDLRDVPVLAPGVTRPLEIYGTTKPTGDAACLPR